MARVVMILNSPILTVATTQAGLTTGDAVECQVTSAVVTASPNFNTIPATGCAPAAQSPGQTSWALDLAWLQDWTVATGLSWFAFTNDGLEVWFELTPDSADATNKLTGNAFAVAGSYGGTFGDGSPAAATATWPLLDKPTVPTPVVMAAETEAAEADAEPQPV
jgi:hypothetical protein